MIRLTEVKLPLDHDENAISAAIISKLDIQPADVLNYIIFRRGYDARKRNVVTLMYTLDVEVKDEQALLARFADDQKVKATPDTSYQFVANAVDNAPDDLPDRPVVIGTGPCGLFVGLVLAQMGFRPIILERGKAVRERTADTFGFWRKRELNTESNVQFGEGGAGTFSDGKLYSQVRDPKNYSRKVLEEFVIAGAPEEILYISKPHIGTFKLVTMVEKMRATIEGLGGEIRFSARVDEIDIDNDQVKGRVKGRVKGVVLADGEYIKTRHVALAVGHSARDTYKMLLDKGVYIEPKPFSIGFRIEHKQSLIDENRFGINAGNPILGAADYKLVHHCANGRSVYSFCMCPGGTVVAATSEEGRVVTNGMSQYSRKERNANSAVVVGINPEEDYPGDVLAGVELQRKWESIAFEQGGGNYNAPAQTVGDFLKQQSSASSSGGVKDDVTGDVTPSFQPGIKLTDLSNCLPDYAIEAIREALPAFDKKIRGFAMPDAMLTGVETRTSAPVRIKRNEQLCSINTLGLYPAGEGAGYAGGILSAGIDGIKIAEAMALNMIGGE